VADFARDHGTDIAFQVIASADATARSTTYAELHELVARCAGGLGAQGIKRGDRVVVFVPMSLELYVVLLALFRVGAVAVFIDPWGGRQMIEAAANLVEADAFIGIPKAHLLRLTSPTIRGLRLQVVAGQGGPRRTALRMPRTISFERLLAVSEAQKVYDAVEVTTADPALITFTGGSTGVPKGADRTHGFLAAQHEILTRNIELARDELCLTNLPIVVLHGLGRGVTMILPPPGMAQDPKIDGTWLHSVILRFGVHVMALSPEPVGGLAASKNRRALESVRRVYTGGGPVLPELLERVKPILPDAEMIAIYGSTEAEPIAHAHGGEVLAKRSEMRHHGGIFVGREVPDINLLLIRPTRGPISVEPGASIADWAVADGTAGEVVVAGDHVNREYFRNPDAFAENKIRGEDGRVWHRTGDVARRDGDGGLWLLGRLTGAMRFGSRTVYPLEVETPVSDLPEVSRAATCQPKFEGSNREFKNASAVLAVEPAEGFTRAQARDAALRRLRELGFHTHVEVRTLKAIPTDKRHGTKIDVDALRKKLKPRETGDY
jgi:acyl-CoA synthetase (AMP-forming)/AMP-acid ligase II